MIAPSTKPLKPPPRKATKPKAKPTAPKPPLNSVPGVIRVDELYVASEVYRRLRWQKHSQRQARRAGLVPTKFGSRSYLTGRQILRFFEKLAEQQEALDPERRPTD